jgi:chloramphenicol-sensitive protein RarD
MNPGEYRDFACRCGPPLFIPRAGQNHDDAAFVTTASSAPATNSRPTPAQRTRVGVLCTSGAFFIWGMVPLYFRLLQPVSPFEVIAHRVLWSMVFMVALLAVTRGFSAVRVVARNPAMLARLGLSSLLVTTNWLTFVWAVNAGRVLETSLGYFITPQVNVLLGLVFLGERLRRTQWVAVALAVAGVLNQIWLLGQLPWISLVLAATFGSYGLFRKQIAVDPLSGLLVETALATPLAVAYLIHLANAGTLHFSHHGWGRDVTLMFLGVVTAVPLMLFTAGAQRLRLTTVGFLQYLAPSMTFLLAIFVFGEPLGAGRMLTFALIWAGIVVYFVDIYIGDARGKGDPTRPIRLTRS